MTELLTPDQEALCADLLAALDEDAPRPEALPGLWDQLQPQLTPAVVQRLSRGQVIHKAMLLNPPWLTGAQALVAAGATVKGYADLAARFSLEHGALDVYQRVIESPSLDLKDNYVLEELIATALRHGHDAIGLDLLKRLNDDEPLDSPLIAADAARRGGPLAPQIVQVALAHTAPNQISNDYLRIALAHGHWDLVASLWPPVKPLNEGQRHEFTQLAAKHGHETWATTLRGETPLDAGQLVAALEGGQDPLIQSFLAQAKTVVIRDAWNTLCHRQKWTAVDRMVARVPRTWGQVLLEMVSLDPNGADQVPQARARERAFQLQDASTETRRRSRPRA